MTEQPYNGKYQDQCAGPQAAISEAQPSLPGLADGPLFEQQMGRSQRPVDMAAAGTVKDWSLDRVMIDRVMTHTIRQEGDEYACRCGRRWDVSEGNEHP